MDQYRITFKLYVGYLYSLSAVHHDELLLARIFFYFKIKGQLVTGGIFQSAAPDTGLEVALGDCPVKEK
jgi:hypothetical protein